METIIGLGGKDRRDGRGWVLDNVFIERRWRSMKYEDACLNAYCDGQVLHEGMDKHFELFNQKGYIMGLTPESR